MASELRYILSAGFGRFADGDPNAQHRFGPDAGAKVKEMLTASIAKAREAGFEVINEDINPQDPEYSLKRFTQQLESRQWVAVNVGFGVRGHKENTVLFEKMLSEVWRIRGADGVNVIFSNGPDDLIRAIERNFPEAFA